MRVFRVFRVFRVVRVVRVVRVLTDSFGRKVQGLGFRECCAANLAFSLPLNPKP